jgi:hypothetical protein
MRKQNSFILIGKREGESVCVKERERGNERER